VFASDSCDPPPSLVARLRAAGCVFAEDEAQLLVATAHSSAELEAMVERRVAGQPLEHVLGWVEFCGLRIAVDPGVFVPRRRTEFLVEQATGLTPASALVVDLCCGCGAVGAALNAKVAGIELHAADIDHAALRCARRNLPPPARVHEGDLFAALPAKLKGRVDTLVVNAPYVPTGAIAMMPPEARLYEPAAALDGGQDGLDVARRVAAEAPSWLAAGASLLIEASDVQAPHLLAIFAGCGLIGRIEASEELGATVVIGTQPRP
jgi:release factor glutamine methyltransferase